MESEAEGNNERKIIPGRVRQEGEIREENKESSRCLHQGAAGLNDKVPIKPRRSLLPAASAELAQVDPLQRRN